MPVACRTSLEPHERNCGTACSESRSPQTPQNATCRDAPVPTPAPTEPPLPRALSSACALRHRGWWHDRSRVHQALHDLYPDSLRPVRFGTCGLKAHVEISDADPPEYRLAGENCRDRWCRPCQNERTRTIAANIIDHLDGAFCRFLTLTIRTKDLTLTEAVHKLYKSFSRLRQTTFWRTRVTGGAATCEIKRTADGTGWHPHLHMLIQGEYVEQGSLGRKWHKITGDSYIVNIKGCDDNTKAAWYVCKYLRKPVPASIVRKPADLRESILALNGRHLVMTFGDWRGLKLTHTESQAAWTRLCTYRELVQRALNGNRESRRILSHLMAQHNLDPSHLDDWIRETQALHRDTQLMLDYT